MWTLSGMLDALRAELRQSLQPFAHGPDALALEMQALRAAQSELCLMHEWPGLRVWADVELNPGQRVYDWPSAATGRPGDHPARIDAAEIRRAVLYDPPSWLDIARGIDPLLYDFHDGDKAERCPCQGGLDARPARWDVWGESGFHIWPVAGKRCQRLRFIVQKQPRPLINMEDEPSLDGHLIVLTAAARCATDDKRRLQLSQRAAEYFSRLKGRCGNAEGWSNLTGGLLAYRRGPQPFAARAMGWRTGA